MPNATYPLVGVIEDDLDLRTIYTELLEHSGFPVAAFPDGDSALSAIMASQVEPKLIVLDFMLPNMNGAQFLQELIRKREIKIPIILVSALQGETPQIAELKNHPWVISFFSKGDITNSRLIDFVKLHFHLT